MNSQKNICIQCNLHMHSFGIGCMNRNEVCKVCEPLTTEVVGEGTANFDDERIVYEKSNMFARRDPEEPSQV